jgi:oligoribonuclease NrnB/cAMP/cGMP phosphodiesterase (DHH superfamily)
MKITVIHHSADVDGIFCREIARHFLLIDRMDRGSPPPEVEFIGWDFTDEPITLSQIIDSDQVYVMDLPLDRTFGFEADELDGFSWNKFVWIDHHATSIASHPQSLVGYRVDGVAACRLAWQWFYYQSLGYEGDLPSKKDFVDRLVKEPMAVQLAGEYDIWDKRNPATETFQYALKCGEIGIGTYHALFGGDGKLLKSMLFGGGIAQRYAMETNAEICKARSFLMKWEGLNFLCINSARFNSLFFESRDIEATGHDALMGFCWTGKQWIVSLYHAKHKTDLDLSQIAGRHGGGGHRGACGFTCKTLPFTL